MVLKSEPMNADLFAFASTALRRDVELPTFSSKPVGPRSRGRTPLNEHKRLAWRAFCQLGRREEEVGTGCAKEQIRQGRDGQIDTLFLHG